LPIDAKKPDIIGRCLFIITQADEKEKPESDSPEKSEILVNTYCLPMMYSTIALAVVSAPMEQSKHNSYLFAQILALLKKALPFSGVWEYNN
jgi:hypothetical protein